MPNYDEKNGTGPAVIASEQPTSAPSQPSFATRAALKPLEGIGRSKLLLLGGGLAVAVLFFVLTTVVGRSSKKHPVHKQSAPQANEAETGPSKGSVTPLMEAVHVPAPDNANGQLNPADIRRTRAADEKPPLPAHAQTVQEEPPPKPPPGASLASVPSFADTQQRWEEPRPYGEGAVSPPPAIASQSQHENSLKEASLVFVRTQVKDSAAPIGRASLNGGTAPFLEVKPGTRIVAKLETQISSAVQAPVVAMVEYTYAISNKVIFPAGARVYGQLQQADRSGLVSVKFDEIELLDGARESIEAIGTGLDLGPIKGSVSGTNSGRNFMVRATSGVGSLLAQVAGTNSGAAFSEQDLLRQRVAENIGAAGDTELMNLNGNSRVVVSVPADTKIYVVFTKHEAQRSSELRQLPPETR